MLPKKILVPTDLSDHAEAALDYACELAKKLGATIDLLNVIGVPALGVPELGVALTSTMIDTLIEDNQIAIDKVADARRAHGFAIASATLKTGDPRDMICQAAEELGADLIIMGTHGRRGVSRMLLGSVAETVVRSAPCAVLTVRSQPQAKRTAA